MSTDAANVNPGSKTSSEKTTKSARKAAQAGPASASLTARTANKSKTDDDGNPWIKVVRRKKSTTTKPNIPEETVAAAEVAADAEPVTVHAPAQPNKSFAATVEDASDSEMSDASNPESPNHNRFIIPGHSDNIEVAEVEAPTDKPTESGDGDQDVQEVTPPVKTAEVKNAKAKKSKSKGKGKAKEVEEEVIVVQPYQSNIAATDVGDDGDTEMSEASELGSPTLERNAALFDEQADFIDLSTSPIKTRAQRASKMAGTSEVGDAAHSSAVPGKSAKNKTAKTKGATKTSAGGHRPLVAEGAEEWAENYRSLFTPKTNRVKAVETQASAMAMKQPILAHPSAPPAMKVPRGGHLPPSSPTFSDMDASPLPPRRPAQHHDSATSPTSSALASRLSRIQSRVPTLPATRVNDTTAQDPAMSDFKVTHDAYPGAYFAGVKGTQVDAWADAEGDKVIAIHLPPLPAEDSLPAARASLIGQGVRRFAAERMLYPDIAVKVSAPVADASATRGPVAYLVYNLPKRVARALLAARGITYPEVSVRFVPFDITIPDLLFGITGWLDIEEDTALNIMYETMTGEDAQAIWLSVHEQYGVQEEQAGAFIDSLRVEMLDIRAPGNVSIPRFNFYADGETLGSDDAWFTIRDAFHNRSYPTLLNGTGRGAEFFECGICLGADHPRGLCPLPDIPGWQGPVRRPNQQNGAGRGQGGFQRGGRGRGFGARGMNYRGRGM